MALLLLSQKPQVVCGYCRDALDYFIPSEIIDLCIAFFDIGEEFDTQMSTLPIEGANQTICRVSNGQLGVLFGKNVIAAKDDYTFYHWRLRVSADSNFKYNIGIVDHALMIIEHELSWVFNNDVDQRSTVIFDLYVNFETSQVCLYLESRKWGWSHSIDAQRKYRLGIQSLAHSTCCTLFEILSFDPAKSNDTPVKMALTTDITSAGAHRKIFYFEKALKENPKSFTHCDEYIRCLHIEGEYDKAYDFILEYNESKCISKRHICSLASFFYSKSIHEKAQKMFELIDDESLKKCGLWLIKASNYYYLEDYENALRYFEFCVANSDNTEIISYCLGCIALIYDNTAKTKGENIDKCMFSSQRLLKYQPNDPGQHSNLGCFYLIKGDYSESYKHLKRSIEIEPNKKCTNGYMANLLYAMKKYDESVPFFENSLHPEVGPKCLWNYANVLFLHQKYEQSNDLLHQLIQRNDFAQHTNRNEVYWFISLNFEKMRNGKKAMQYAKEAQRIQSKEMYAN